MDAGPIFVGGLERSGTSLIYALLGSHPAIAMTRRTNWWTYFYGRFGDLADDANLERCLATMLSYRRHRKLEPDPDRLRRELRSGERTYGRLFELLEAHHAERLGKPRWGDKSLHTERYADLVFRTFPSARILHMVRDPRDRHASVLRRWKRVRGGVGASTAAWVASVRLGERNTRDFAGRYRMVRYEDLARRPERTLRWICDFIGEPFVPAMLEMRGAETFREAGNSSYGVIPEGTISTSSIGRFRSVLRPADIVFIQARAGRVMVEQGYELEPVAFHGGSTFRYRLVDWPLNMARMAAWRTRERAFDLLGRTPSAHTMVEAELS